MDREWHKRTLQAEIILKEEGFAEGAGREGNGVEGGSGREVVLLVDKVQEKVMSERNTRKMGGPQGVIVKTSRDNPSKMSSQIMKPNYEEVERSYEKLLNEQELEKFIVRPKRMQKIVLDPSQKNPSVLERLERL